MMAAQDRLRRGSTGGHHGLPQGRQHDFRRPFWRLDDRLTVLRTNEFSFEALFLGVRSRHFCGGCTLMILLRKDTEPTAEEIKNKAAK